MLTPGDIEAAAHGLAGVALRTPLMHLDLEGVATGIYLKPECLQPVGSFKIRPAVNFIAAQQSENLARGVYTASSGNSGLGLGFAARLAGAAARVIVPDKISSAKRTALERTGAVIRTVSFDHWWRVIRARGDEGESGLYFDAVGDPAALAGNATIGLEILEDLPDCDTIVAPFGGGGLSVGIAQAVKAANPDIRVLGAEIETARPLAAALKAGRPVTVNRRPSLADAIGVDCLLGDMWPLVARWLDGAAVATVAETARAIRLLYQRARLIAEGAGAVSVAAALAGLGRGEITGRKIVCIVSGGNITGRDFANILAQPTPECHRER